MPQILLIFTILFSLGTYLIITDLLKLPSRRAMKALYMGDKREKRKTKNFDIFIIELSTKISKYIKLTNYNKRKIAATLKSANIKLSPEAFIAKAWVKAGLTLLLIVPVFLVFPIIFPVILFLSVAIYFKEINSAKEALRKRREDIEFEMPRFVSSLTQELKANRNVLQILETYKQNAGESFRDELEITVADMKSGSYESALTRFETRLGSSGLSDVVRGLIGVIQGDDSVVYFQLLSHDHSTQRAGEPFTREMEKQKYKPFKENKCRTCRAGKTFANLTECNRKESKM